MFGPNYVSLQPNAQYFKVWLALIVYQCKHNPNQVKIFGDEMSKINSDFKYGSIYI